MRSDQENIPPDGIGPSSKRHKGPTALPGPSCTVCGRQLPANSPPHHRGCKAQTAFFSSKKLLYPYDLQRDSQDNKVPCPFCPYRDYDIDFIKKHILSCPNLPPKRPLGLNDESATPPNPQPLQQPLPRPPLAALKIPTPPSHTATPQDARLSTLPTSSIPPQPQIHTGSSTRKEHSAGGHSRTRPMDLSITYSPPKSTTPVHATPLPSLQLPLPSTTRAATAHVQDTQNTVQPPLLVEHGLVVNTEHCVVICIACLGIINPYDVRDHFVDHHKAFKPRRDLQQSFDLEILSDYPDLTYHPSQPIQPVQPIYGLASPLPGYIQCLTCRHCYASKKTFNLHHCSNPAPSSTPTNVQRFMNHNGSPWFPVTIPPPPSSLVRDPWSLYQQHAARAPQTPTKPAQEENYRVFHQFLQKEGWIEHIQGRKHEDLFTIASYSSTHPIYGTLHKHIGAFLLDMQPVARPYYIRRLISTRPTEEHDETRVRHHKGITPPAIDAYAKIVAGAICCIHRVVTTPSSDYTFPIPSDISSACIALISSLSPSSDNDDAANQERVEHPLHYDSDDDSDLDDDEDDNTAHNPLTQTFGQSDHPPTTTEDYLTHLLSLLYTQTPSSDIRGEFFSPLTHYILLSSLRKGDEWAPSGVITHNIAALLFTGRLVFAWKISKILSTTTKTVHEAFESVEKYFLEKTESILPSLYLLKRGLSSLQSAEQSTLLFNAPDLSGEAAIINGEVLSLNAIGTVLTRTIHEITSEIDELTFHHPQFLLSTTDIIHDEPRERKAGYSFLTDERNIWNQRPTLVQHILQSHDLFPNYAYLTPEGVVSWIPTVVAPLAEKIYQLQKKLMCAIILSYGEPARGTELASHILTNIGGGSIRNFFVLFNVPFLRGSFNKTSTHQGADRGICRFPLPELGHQFVRFLVFIRPLYFEWQTYLRPDMSQNAQRFLFAGLHRAITSQDISAALAAFTTRELNIRLTLRKYRQFMAFMTNYNQVVFAATADHDTGTHDQFGHSMTVNTQHYGQDSGTPDGMNIKTFIANARVSAVFHLLYGHPPTLLESLESSKPRIEKLLNTIAQIRNPAQSPPSVNSAGISLQSPRDAVDPGLFAKVQTMVDTAIAKSHAAVANLFADKTTIHSTSTPIPIPPVVAHPFIVKKLRQMYPEFPSNTAFTNSQQAQVTQLLYEGDRHVAYLSPTGSGKTTPIMLSAKYLDGPNSTICLLPLVAMHLQFQHCANTFGITAESWTPNTSNLVPPKLILATIDLATFPHFKNYVKVLVRNKRVARVVIDEAHLILTHADFRPVMALLQWLASISVPIIIMTATLPPSLEQSLFIAVGITSVVTVRAPTPRPNISFRVVRAQSKLEHAVAQVFQEALSYSGQNRILIFCLTVREAEYYGQQFNIPACHSGLGFEQLGGILDRFRNDPGTRAIASTSILGVGLNIPNITHVIHVNFPRDVVAFIQESGRAGRAPGNPPAFSIVVLPTDMRVPSFPPQDSFGRHVLHTSLTDDSKCRRLAMQTFLDGQADPCAMLSGTTHFCDVCERESLNPPPRVPSLSNIVAAEHSNLRYGIKPFNYDYMSQELELVHQRLNYYSNACIACALRGPQNEAPNHLFRDCKRYPSLTTDSNAFRQFARSVIYPVGTCYQCGISQKAHYCNRHGETMYLHEYNTDGTQPCPYAFIVTAIAFSIHEEPELRRNIGRKITTVRNGTNFSAWITETELFTPHSNAIRLVLHCMS